MSEKGYDEQPGAKEQKVDLRLPGGMRDQLAIQARKDQRSANSQIVHYIEMGLKGMDATTVAQAIFRLDAAIQQIQKQLSEK